MRHTDERHSALQEVTCDRCAAVVRVAKFSPQHTSVQWDGRAVGTCAEFAERSASQVPAASCASLRESIDLAVRDGRLKVGTP
jgi:hypothetical protein